MWTRVELKERAKGVLRKYYWMAFAVTLVAEILGGFGSGFSSRFQGHDHGFWNLLQPGNWLVWHGRSIFFDFGTLPGALFGALTAVFTATGIFMLTFGVGLAFIIFLGGPVEVGMDRYFLEARQDRSDFVNLFCSFRNGKYLNIVKATAWRVLFTCLWTLLFLIPGIVKYYAYSMIPYLMADNPDLDYKRAMVLSMAMTQGKKGDIFVLDLSFILWILACLCTCGIGFFFLSPYFWGTRAELYAELRQQALVAGICTPAEVGLA